MSVRTYPAISLTGELSDLSVSPSVEQIAYAGLADKHENFRFVIRVRNGLLVVKSGLNRTKTTYECIEDVPEEIRRAFPGTWLMYVDKEADSGKKNAKYEIVSKQWIDPVQFMFDHLHNNYRPGYLV